MATLVGYGDASLMRDGYAGVDGTQGAGVRLAK
jgi:hypothetical protein